MSKVNKFEIASEQGILLETEGRYCPHNIKVVPRLSPLTASEAGKYPVPDGYAGYGEVNVDIKLKSLTVTQRGTYSPPEGYKGFDEVIVDTALENTTITANGTYTPSEGKVGFGEVKVNVPKIPLLVEVQMVMWEDQYLRLEDVGYVKEDPNETLMLLAVPFEDESGNEYTGRIEYSSHMFEGGKIEAAIKIEYESGLHPYYDTEYLVVGSISGVHCKIIARKLVDDD